jgi:beta-mannosidase
LNAGIIEDSFYRDNEYKVLQEAEYDYEFKREFFIDEECLSNDVLMLCCEGLDTLSKIEINGKSVTETNNMHRSYELDIEKTS